MSAGRERSLDGGKESARRGKESARRGKRRRKSLPFHAVQRPIEICVRTGGLECRNRLGDPLQVICGIPPICSKFQLNGVSRIRVFTRYTPSVIGQAAGQSDL